MLATTETRRRDLDADLDAKENWPEPVALTSIFLVELPGIEPGLKIGLNCVNSGIDDAKRRETT
jgi:hypothetical protein